MELIRAVCNLLWGDLLIIPLPGGGSIGLSLMVLLLVPAGIYFTIRTRVLPIRMFPEMLRISVDETVLENPTAIDLWVEKDKTQIIHIPAGARVVL